MMRRTGFVAALALLLGACGPVAADNRSNKIAELSLPADYEPLAPLTVDLAWQGGTCRAAVAGEALDSDRLAELALRTLENSVRFQEIDRGWAETLPPAVIRMEPELPWRCVAGGIYQLRRIGFGRLRFEPRSGVPVEIDAPLVDGPNEGPRPVKAVVIGADGSILFDGARLAPERLSEALRTFARERPRAMLAIMPAAQTRIGDVVALLLRAREAGVELTSSDPIGWVGFDYADGAHEMETLKIYASELK